MRLIKAGRPEKPKKKPGIKMKKGATNRKINIIISLLLANLIACSVILLKLYGVLDQWLQKIL
jgi:hypothetical protein